MINALCFDIDDLSYSLHAKGGLRLSSRYLVEQETMSLLEFLNTLGVRATMFVPGYVAQRFPGLVRAMVQGGHEVAGHGHRHIEAKRLTRQEFGQDIRDGKKALEDIISRNVQVYKDPCWGITEQTPWAYDELIEAGYRIDNTAQPSLLKALGRSARDMMPFTYKEALTVIPVTSAPIFGKTVSFNGGMYCAYIPAFMQIRYYRRLNRNGLPFNYYCHPYEISPEGANRRIWSRGSFRAAFYGIYFGIYRHYLRRLASHFTFAPLSNAYETYCGVHE